MQSAGDRLRAADGRVRLGTVSTQAIYDVVHALTRVGLLGRVAPAGSRALFEIEIGDNHHHLVRRGCGSNRRHPLCHW